MSVCRVVHNSDFIMSSASHMQRVIMDKMGILPTRCLKTTSRTLLFWKAGMTCCIEWLHVSIYQSVIESLSAAFESGCWKQNLNFLMCEMLTFQQNTAPRQPGTVSRHTDMHDKLVGLSSQMTHKLAKLSAKRSIFLALIVTLSEHEISAKSKDRPCWIIL